MAMTKRTQYRINQSFLCDYETLVPQNHLVRKLDKVIDWDFIYPLVEGLYSKYGRPSIDPVVLFKMLFINFTFGYNSMRKTCRSIETDFAYRWFLNIGIYEKVPNYSTWSQNYIRRYNDADIFDEIFMKILSVCISKGFVDTSTVFGDSTHQKANANKNKHEKKEVEIVKKIYEDRLLEEINEDRLEHGKKRLKSTEITEQMFDEDTGELITNIKTKTIKSSTTDPESGCFHKGEKERCFAYSHQTFCDGNGFVLAHTTVPGNTHDSVSFFDCYNLLNSRFEETIEYISLDAGYVTPAICKIIIDNEQIPIMPYKRPMTKKGFFRKYEFVYDEAFDCYICPENKILNYSNTNKKGYREYKSKAYDCSTCINEDKCTLSFNNVKVITRHVWEDYKEVTNEYRYTEKWKEIYPRRKETVERVFADCKEHHGLRYSRFRGLKKNRHYSTIIFACHNLKRLANWTW